jgi:putative FmdB family regulatory protein
MPVYEYRCQACNKKFSALIGMTAEPDEERCPNCGASDTKRLISRFARLRTEDDRIDEMADELEIMGEPDSPSQMRTMAREMGKAMDEDMADEMEEIFESDMEGKTGDDD